MSEIRVEHFRKARFAITSRILKILTEHKVIKNRLDSKLQIDSTCSVRILNILKVIAKTSFSKIAKCSTLIQVDGQKNPEKIEPEDVMSKDCCNLGAPDLKEVVYYYNCQKDLKCKGIMMGTKEKRVYCIVNEHEKQYQIGTRVLNFFLFRLRPFF